MGDTFTEPGKSIVIGANMATIFNTGPSGVETCGTYRRRVPRKLYSDKPLRRPKRQLTGERLKEIAARNPPPPEWFEGD